MEILAAIVIIAVVIVLIVNRGNETLENIDPSKLTTEQLEMHDRMYSKRILMASRVVARQDILKPKTARDIAMEEKLKKLQAQREPIQAELRRRWEKSQAKRKAS